MGFLLVVVLIALIALIRVEYAALQEHREIRRQLHIIASLTRDTRSSQGSIGIRRSNGGAMPEMPRAKQYGPRDDIPATAKQKRGLKFERKGGEYERNREPDA